MAASSELNTFSVGEISQNLSTKKKRKKSADENSNLSSLFSSSSVQKPVFVKVVEAPKAKKTEGKSAEKTTTKKRKGDDDSDDSSDEDVPVKKSRKESDETVSEAADARLGKKKTKTAEDPERLARTIFVGNVPKTLTTKAFKKYFKKFGEVESVRFRSAALSKPNLSKAVGMKRKEFHKDRHNMNGYVVYTTAENARSAMASNGEEIREGFHIRVDFVDNHQNHDNSRSVFVGNLPFDAEEEPLRELFSTCGPVESVRLIRDNKTGIGKGFGYVLYQNRDAVMFALKLNNKDFKGRNLRVFLSKDKPKTGNVQKGRKQKPQTHSFSGMKATRPNKEHSKRKFQGNSSKPFSAGRSVMQKKPTFDRRMGNPAEAESENSENARKRLKHRDTRKSYASNNKNRGKSAKKRKT